MYQISHQKELRHDRDVWLYINSNNHDISTPVTVLNKAAVGSMVRTVCKKPGAGRHDSHKPNGESSRSVLMAEVGRCFPPVMDVLFTPRLV